MAAPVTLRCSACGYENESQRVYCHNCGSKLDRRLLPPELQKGPDNAKVEQHIKKITDPRRGILKHRIKGVLKCVGSAALIGFLATILRVPDSTPEKMTEDAMADAPFIYDVVQAATGQPQTRRFPYTQTQANGYLQRTYRPRDSGVPLLRFERTFVVFEEGTVEVTAEMSIFGLPLQASARNRVVLRDGRIDNKVVGGRIGRWSVPGPVMSLAAPAFGPLWTLVDKERKVVAQLQSITFRDGVVELVTKGN